MARDQLYGRQPTSLGNRLAMSEAGNLTSFEKAISRPAVTATISVSAEAATAADTRDLIITVKDAEGNTIDYVEVLELIVFLDAGGVDFVVTGGTTGITVNAAAPAGKLLAQVAKKTFRALTTVAGVLNLRWLDTGTEVAFLGVRLPNGVIVMSSALTNA